MATLPIISGGQSRSAPLQKHGEAEATGADLHATRTVGIALSSRRVDDAVSPVRASQLYGITTNAMRKTSLNPVTDATTADLSLDIVVESHEPRGAESSKSDPYIFLLLRDRSNAGLLYCAYRRVGFSYSSAMRSLLHDLSTRTTATAALSTGDMEACAAEAKRPVDLVR